MLVRHALSWLLPLLAVLSLALAPLTVPVAASSMRAAVPASAVPMAGMDMARMQMSPTDRADTDTVMDASPETAMPCCPHGPSGVPDCGKACPMMALCVAKAVAGLPAGAGLPLRIAVAQATSWEGDEVFASLVQAPLPEPPRS